jgi:putative heme-binding domain-containing protein
MLLVRMAQQQQLSAAARALAATQIEQCPDLAVRALARAQFPAASDAPGSERKSAVLALQGDARNGQKLFFGERARCYSCHRFYERGGEIGPDLSAVALKYGRGELLESILNPSAAIAFGYDAWMVETTDGSLYTGFITSDNGKQLVLKDTTGRLEVLPSAEVETKTKQKLSVMPDNAAMGLSEQELADLLEFLRSNPRVPGRRLSEQALFNGQDFTGWTFHSDTRGAKLEEVFTIENSVLVCKGNPIGYLRTTEDYTNFELSLEWRHDPRFSPGNSGVLMRMHGADKVWPKSIEAQLQHRNAGDIWNIDEFPMQTEASRTEGRWTGKAQPCNEKPLGEWNRYDITLDGGELRLYVNGELQNAAHWCEELPGKICLQSEGAVIQFRNIRIRKIERD